MLEELAQMPAPRMGFHIRGGDKLTEDVQLVSMARNANCHGHLAHCRNLES